MARFVFGRRRPTLSAVVCRVRARKDGRAPLTSLELRQLPVPQLVQLNEVLALVPDAHFLEGSEVSSISIQ